MLKFIYLFILITTILLTAWAVDNSLKSTPLTPSVPSPTDKSLTTETQTPAPTTPHIEMKSDHPDANVIYVKAIRAENSTWTFHVTVEHPDTGWDDYADGWDVVTPDGTVLKVNPDDPFTRLLLHPHETEQPFTRSQGGILIPDGVTQVRVRAHDILDGFGG